MFNLFPKKKSVDEIIEDADVTPSWVWNPTQTPSMLHAQNEIIGELIKKNNKLTDDYNALLNKGGLKYMEAKLQIVQNDYKKCTEQRDEYKHQLNAANKEIESLKWWKEDMLVVMKQWDEVDQYVRNHKDIILGEFIAGTCLHFLKERDEYKQAFESMKVSYGGEAKSADKLLKEKIALEERQKHPMYPIHWGGITNLYNGAEQPKGTWDGCDGAASSYPEDYSKWLNEQKEEKTWEQAASDLALRVIQLEKKVTELSIIKMSTGYKGEF